MSRSFLAFGAAVVLLAACQTGDQDKAEVPPASDGAFELHHTDEIPALRTGTSWTRALPDGKRLAHISTAPIHYTDETGTLRKIDVNIVPVARRDLPNAAFGVEKNLFKTYFPARAGEGVTVELPGGHRIEMWRETAVAALDDAYAPLHALVPEASLGEPREHAVSYRGSFRNIDERFTAGPVLLKHDVEIKSRDALPSVHRLAYLAFSEDVVLSHGLRLSCDGQVIAEPTVCQGGLEVMDASGGFIAGFRAPWYRDAASAAPLGPAGAAGRAAYLVSPGNGVFRLSVVVPFGWLNDEARVFPVVIDPTVSPEANADTWIFSSCPDTNGSPYQAMYAGRDGGDLFVDCSPASNLRALVKADLSSVPIGATVDAATFNAYLADSWYDGTTTSYTVSRLTGAWSEAVTWNTQPGIDSPEATVGIPWSYDIWISWSIPVMAQYWASNPTGSHGLAIRHWNEGSQTSMRQFWTREYSGGHPYFSVTYTPDSTAPAFQSTTVTGARYQNGNDYWVRGGEQVKIAVRHFDNQSGLKIQQVDLYNGSCNSWIDHYWDSHSNIVSYVPGGCSHVTFPAPTAEEIENAGGYTTTRFTAQFTGGDYDYPVQGRAWDYATNDSNLANDGKYVKTDDTDPSISNLSPSGGFVSGVVTVSADVTDARSGLKSVVFSIGDAACSGGWTDLGAPSQAGNTFSSSWDTSGRPEGTYCIRAVGTDNADRTATATTTVSVDRTAPSITSRQLDKAQVIPNGSEQLTVTIAAQDSSNPVWWIKGRINFDGSADLAACQNNPPDPPCRGSFVWSPDQSYLVASGYVSITSCSGGGYGALIDAWGGSTYLTLASCTGGVAGNAATAAWTISLTPAFGEHTGNWISADAADISNNVGSWGPTAPAAPMFDTLAPTPTTPQFSPVPPAFTKGTSINLQWTASSEPVYGIKEYEAARTNTPAEAQSCGASPPAGYTSSGAVGGTNHIFSGLVDGQKYCHWVRAKSNADKYSAWSNPASSTQDNTNPTCALDGVTGTAGIVYFNTTIKRVYYNNSTSGGNIDVLASGADAASGIVSINFPTIGGFSGSGNDTTAPYRSSDVSAYSFTPASTFTGSGFAICTDGVNNQTPASYSIERDILAPEGGLISYPNGTSGAAAVTVQWDDGSDSGSGLGSVQLRRAEAAYSGGSCGSFGPFADVGNQTVGGLSWIDTGIQVNKCYKYEALVADNVGNAVTYDNTNVFVRIPGAPADPAKSTISAAPQTLPADGAATSTILVTAIDTNSQNMGAGQAVAIAIEAGTGTLLGTVEDKGNGTYTQLLQAGTKPGSATLSATINGVLLNGRATVTYVVGPVDKDKTEIIAVPASIVADGSSTSTIVVTPKDAGGNLIGKGQTVTVTLASGTGTLSGAVADKQDGTYEQTVTSPTAAGSGEFEAEVNSVKITSRAAVTYTAGGAAKLAFVVQPPAAVQAGAVMAPFSVAVADANGNVVTGDNATQITLSLDAGTGTPQGTLLRAVSAGVASFDDVSHRTAETIRFRARSAPPHAEATSSDVVVSAGPADHVVATALAGSVLIGTQAAVEIAVKDRFENTAAGAREVTVTVDRAAQIAATTLAGASGIGTAAVTGTTAADGTAQVSVTDATPEVVTVAPDGAGLPEQSQNVAATVQFVRETPDHIVLSIPAGEVRAGVSRVITAKVRDKNDQDLSAQVIVTIRAEKGAQFTATTLAASSGIGTAVLSGTIPASGAAEATITDTVAETVNVVPEAQLAQTMPHTGVTVTFVPNVPAGTVTLLPNPAKIRADGVSVSTVTSGEIKDQYGNVERDGTLITVASSKGNINASDASAANAGIQVATLGGVVTFDVRADATPGVADVTVASVEGSAAGAATLEFAANGAPTADAGADVEAVGGDAVTLDGSASSDPEGDALTFVWTQTAGEPVALSDATAEKPGFDAPDVSDMQELEFALVVNDGLGASAPDTVKVTVTPGAGAAPKITSTPALKATTGEPYHYDDNDTAEASGRTPIAWSKVGGPAEFSIDATSGRVTWTPVAFGPAEISIKAENAWGSDVQTFTADVTKGATPEPPSAVLAADPDRGDAPLDVSFYASGSTAGAGATIVQYRWDFGDATGASGQGKTASHTYPRPGVYRAGLTVVDDWGQSGSASAEITVMAKGLQPPTVKIVADKTEGEAPLQVSFSAECTDDGRIVDYLWDFGDGSAGTVEKPAHVFQSGGSWPVTLLVRDDDGLSGSDKKIITVTAGGLRPPAVKISASTSSGEAPLDVEFTAVVTEGDGEVTSRRWTVDRVDAGSGETLSRTFDQPGRYLVALTVYDSNELSGSDVVTTNVLKNGLVPPEIVSSPDLTARAGIEYRYAARAVGDPPIEWSLVKGPAEMGVDSATGEITWTPPANSPPNADVTISASNAAGEDKQGWTIIVGGAVGAAGADGGTTPDAPGLGDESAGGCSCATASASPADLAAIVLSLALMIGVALLAPRVGRGRRA
ncbi:MAG: PKD domain-containing protein [Deltaproteobacteria bacterium]|nr:PKD domain-containing protein [Deltaproteobacteria bacterium]